MELKTLRTPIVAGNWKMNGSLELVASIAEAWQTAASELTDIEVVIFPPAVYLSAAQQAWQATQIKWGGQNLSEYAPGAYTGEIAAPMLQEMACQYVLLGHSERRSIYGETVAQITAKFMCAQAAGLRPILCVGETQEERDKGQTMAVISNQLIPILALGTDFLADVVIAYEPVWAIGTGLTATPEQAQAVHADIRKLVAEHAPNIAPELRILYGGSVKPNNAKELFAMADIDGGLIGGASLNADSFLQICRAAVECKA